MLDPSILKTERPLPISSGPQLVTAPSAARSSLRAAHSRESGFVPCQKAVAGPFTVLAEVPWGDFAWTRGAPSTFRSSSRAARDFCAACGTPLSYRHPDGPIIELLTGAFDQPAHVAPTYQVGVESRLDWLPHLADLPGKTSLENMGATKAGAVVSHQHPDHDTAG